METLIVKKLFEVHVDVNYQWMNSQITTLFLLIQTSNLKMPCITNGQIETAIIQNYWESLLSRCEVLHETYVLLIVWMPV